MYEENLSGSTLETSLYLFRLVLSQRPRGHPMRGGTLHHLFRALLVRFTHRAWIEDLDEATELAIETSLSSKQALPEHDWIKVGH